MKIGKYLLVNESDLVEIYARAYMIDYYQELELNDPEAEIKEYAAGKLRATASAIMKIVKSLLK